MQYKQLTGIAQKLTEDAGAGRADITSDPAFQELQVALAGKAGSQMGDAVIEAQPPDYKKSLSLSTGLLAQSKHLDLFVGLVKGATGVHGFTGLAESLSILDHLVTNHWTELYPEEDKDDPDDPWWERINPLRELTDSPDTIDLLNESVLVDVKQLGAFSKRDIDIANGRVVGTDEEKERCNSNLIRGAFTETDAEQLVATDASMTEIVSLADSLDSKLSDLIGSDAPSFGGLKNTVVACQGVFREYAGSKLDAVADPVAAVESSDSQEASDVGGVVAPATAGSVQTTVTVTSSVYANRDKVAEAFDSVMRFYQKFEPSSPVPILLYRAREMVYKNFFDILRELAPQHQDNFRQLMSTLKDDPLNFLLEHSYNAFLNGEKFEVAKAEAPHSADTDVGAPAEGLGENSSADTSVSAEAEPSEDQSLEITSREQVLQTLSDIQKFFEQHEPSSPISLLVQKVRNLVPKNFMDLLDEFESVGSADSGSGAEPVAAQDDAASSEWT